VNCLHIFLVTLNFLIYICFESRPKVLILLKFAQFLSIKVPCVQLIKHSIGTINMRLNKNGVRNGIFIVLLCILLIISILLIFTILLGFLPQGIIDQNVIQVFKLLQPINSLILVSMVTLIAAQYELIACHIQNLHIILEVFQIVNCGIKISHLILTKRKHPQLTKLIKPFNILNTIIIQRQIC